MASDAPELFPEVLRRLRETPDKEKSNRAGLFATSLIAFLLVGVGTDSVTTLLVLVGVLLFHELGHLAAMRVFGYRDLGVFFIPWFGAAATGKKERATGWEETIVFLAGPAPGLLLGFGLILLGSGGPSAPLLDTVASLLVVVNALNLLPFEPFDGGRVAGLLIFANHPRSRVRFGAFGALVLVFIAYREGYWLLAVVAALQVLAWPFRAKLAGVAESVRARLGQAVLSVPANIAQAPDEVVRVVFDELMAGLWNSRAPSSITPQGVARSVTNVYTTAITPSTSLAPRLALGLLYGVLLVPSVALMIATRTNGNP